MEDTIGLGGVVCRSMMVAFPVVGVAAGGVVMM